jgi:hypothetical protein
MAANEVFTVHTDLNPEQLTEVAIETYRRWLNFALGKDSLMGSVLRHPSGRYAASLSWKKTGTAAVAIIADEKIAPEALWIEEGASAHSMKEAMLGKGNTKTSAAGYQYRVIPIRKDGYFPQGTDANPEVVNTPTGGGISAATGKIWSRKAPAIDASHFAIMSDKPGASDWIVPAMPAYSPAAILASLLKQEFGKK